MEAIFLLFSHEASKLLKWDDTQHSKDAVSCDLPVASLYEVHALAIFAYLRRQALSREDAEDVLVEVFLPQIPVISHIYLWSNFFINI